MSEESMKVDMLAAARDAQWSADTFLGVGSVKLVSPAKVNLFLGVGPRREDGLHEVVNVMHALALHDVMFVRSGSLHPQRIEELSKPKGELPKAFAVGGPAENVLVSIDVSDRSAVPGADPLNIPAESNIVFRAIDMLARAVGRTEPTEVGVRIEKNIPHQGGLGGGSSNAAAAVRALAYLWGVSEDDPAVMGPVCKLGADVRFFLHGGCVLLTGAGEVLEHGLAPMKDPVVLVKPPVGVSTPEAYRAFDEAPVFACEETVERVRKAEAAHDVPLFNGLTAASHSVSAQVAEVDAWLREQTGVRSSQDVMLCGSGATTFAVTDDFAAACSIAAAAQARGWWARATTFSSLRAAIVPQRR